MKSDEEEEEGETEKVEEKQLSPADKRRLEAEKRAAWRQARLRSLENVSVVKLLLPTDHCSKTLSCIASWYFSIYVF